MQFKPKLKTAKKRCQFEGCKEIFVSVVSGGNHGKYCQEHRKQKYRKFIDKDKIKEKREQKLTNSINQIIKHSFQKSQVITGTCQLEGCGRNFDILLVPNTFTYPRFCPCHRNEYKRGLFLKHQTQ